MAKKKEDPAAGLAEKLLAVLEAQRALGSGAYPLTVRRLAELADPQATEELVKKALGKQPFKDQTILAKKEMAAPVALAADLDQLAASPLLLEYALEHVCKPDKRTCLPTSLKGKVDKPLKEPFAAAVIRQIEEGTLPPAVGSRVEKKKPVLFLERMPPEPLPEPVRKPAPPKKPDVVLAEQLLAVLEAQRDLGSGAYPTTIARLAELADAQAPSELVGQAVGKNPFKDRAVVAQKKNPASPVALAEDLEQLAESRHLLEFALKQVCTLEKPTITPAKLTGQVDKSLKKPFEAALNRQIQENELPQGVGTQVEKNKPVLYLKDIPPKSHPKKPEEVLAWKLLQTLQDQQRAGGDAYPLPLSRLLDLAGAKDELPTLRKKALSHRSLRGKLVMAAVADKNDPTVLLGDRDELVANGWLLDFLLKANRTETEQAFAVEKLVKNADLAKPLAKVVEQQIEAGLLPPGVGWMWVGGKRQLFFLSDVHGRRQTEAPPATASPAEPSIDFGPAFDEAFVRFDRQNGAHNFVSLVPLRQALPVSRDRFDAELRMLRLAGRYTLSGAEGRHGITDEERQSGVMEDGSLLLYVSRKNP